MKKISSIILAIAFFAVIILPSFYIPINKESPIKEIITVQVEKQVPVIEYVTPKVIDLPEVIVEARLKPRYIEIPTYIPGDTVYRYLPMPLLDKLETNICLLDDVEPQCILDLTSNTQENSRMTAMWP